MIFGGKHGRDTIDLYERLNAQQPPHIAVSLSSLKHFSYAAQLVFLEIKYSGSGYNIDIVFFMNLNEFLAALVYIYTPLKVIHCRLSAPRRSGSRGGSSRLGGCPGSCIGERWVLLSGEA